MLYPVQNEVRNKLDLSGIWDFQSDPEELGERNGWFAGLESPRPMAVPGSWNEQYADLYNYLGLGWYVRRTYVPNSWQGQRVFLRVGSANYQATVYVNGVQVGSHEGGHLPFAFEVTDQIQWGQENVLAISVENHLKPTRVPAGNMPSPLCGFASFPQTTFDFFPFAGLHRPVLLYSVPSTFISDVTVVTGIQDEDGKVLVTVRLNETVTASGRLMLKGAGTEERAALSFHEGLGEANITIHHTRLWSDSDPFLYDLSVQPETDHYTLKVGIRTIEAVGGQILLNGKPVVMNRTQLSGRSSISIHRMLLVRHRASFSRFDAFFIRETNLCRKTA